METEVDEFAALVKRVEWLERESRKDRGQIADLKEEVASYENNFGLLRTQIKELSVELSKYTSYAARLDQFDLIVSQYRTEFNKGIEDIDKRVEKRDRETDLRRRSEVESLNRSILDLRKTVEVLDDLKKGISARAEEHSRLVRIVSDMDRRLEEFPRSDEEIRRSVRVVDDARRNDVKRIADIQGEIAAIRKRSDDAREKADLNADTLRILDTRVNELLSSESDRRQAQMSFIEQQSLANVDRDRLWKEMQARFEGFFRQTTGLDAQIAQLEETQRSVKRSQEAFDDMNVRIERRIKEITEIQRLAEDRFRQEWVSFKADDQKRWTNYSLSQDETHKDVRVELEKLNTRVAATDDVIQTLQDLIQQTNEATETHLQELMNWVHEWLTSFERITGRPRGAK